MSISWTLFKLTHSWNLVDLDSTLQKGDESFKFINEFRYLGVEDLPHEFLIKKICLIDADFLENRTGEITGWSIFSIYHWFNRLGVELSSLLITMSRLLWGNECFYVFDSHSKDGNGNISAAGTAFLLKFGFL